MQLSKYSIGIGDRFSHQGKAQLRAILTIVVIYRNLPKNLKKMFWC